MARLSHSDFAMVFTSGIAPYVSREVSGPTEKFISNFGPRVHHIAFQTEEIEATVDALEKDGMKFLLPLVGSPEEGLKQILSQPSENTLLVTEYIHRYGDFDAFFTRSNVTKLTAATDKQQTWISEQDHHDSASRIFDLRISLDAASIQFAGSSSLPISARIWESFFLAGKFWRMTSEKLWFSPLRLRSLLYDSSVVAMSFVAIM
ncbi:MAG TPA: hypothetical protein PKG62_04005 [Methanothrix soehngenii]|nr:hypothetical protein [Methanothrix soehngenii]